MFEYISERFGSIFDKLRHGGQLTEDNIREGLRDVRRALLEADVNVGVVRDFLAKVEAKAIGTGLIEGVQPGQQVVQIVHDELVALMGEPAAGEAAVGEQQLDHGRPVGVSRREPGRCAHQNRL